MSTTIETVVTAELALDGFTLTATGEYDRDNWEIVESYPNAGLAITPRRYTIHDYIYDESDIEEVLWEHAIARIKDNTQVMVSEEEVEVTERDF